MWHSATSKLYTVFHPFASRWSFLRQSCVRFRIYPRYLSSDYSWRLTKRKSRRIRGSDLMSLNNSRGFSSILLVNFSILHTALSSPRMERKTWGSLLSCRDQPKTRSSVSGFSTQVIRAKIYACECASDWDYNKVIWLWFVKTAFREKTCPAFALSRAQRVCNCAPQNVSLYNLYRNDGHKLRFLIPFQLI